MVDPDGFAAAGESLPPICWLLFLANLLWVVAYDTLYAAVDRDDDLKIGVKSTAILFGRHDRLAIGVLQGTILVLMAVVGRVGSLGWEFYLAVGMAGALFVRQQRLIARRERDGYFRAFMSNNHVGLVLFLGLLASHAW